MSKRVFFIATLVLLALALWSSQNLTTVAAGVSIFLFGMLYLKEGFTAFTGGMLEKILRASTDNLFKSHLFGVVSTTLMQSSSLISVITISFLSAGLIELTQGVGIIFGANIGTTTGAWLMAAFGMKVKISAYAMPMIVFGLILSFQDRKEVKGIGSILTGLGFLFLGIHFMKEGFDAFKDTIDLAQYAVGGIKGLLLFCAIGVLATVVMQSSHATLMLIIAALSSGQITYENALALAIGANIGTTITAILGAISSNAAGRRLAGAHLIFNSVTAIVAIGFMPQFRWAVDHISSVAGIANDDWTLKLAVFHTLFNLAGVLLMIPLIPRMVTFLETRIKGATVGHGLEPLYLYESALELPDTAMGVLAKETVHLFDNAFEIVAHGLNLHRHDILSLRPLETMVGKTRKVIPLDISQDYQESIKTIYSAIIEFATRVRLSGQLTSEQFQEVDSIRIVGRSIAEIVKGMSTMRENLVEYLKSDNEHISRQYDLIRLRLAGILREIYRIREIDDEMEVLMAFEEMKLGLKEADVLNTGTLDRLVRDSLITNEMASSLINDSATTRDIGERLIEIGERMFIKAGSDLKEIYEDLFIERGRFDTDED